MMFFPKSRKSDSANGEEMMEFKPFDERFTQEDVKPQLEEQSEQTSDEEAILPSEETAEEKVETKEKKTVSYKYSIPSPMPKDLVAVLKEMLKKLFPDVLKAYLVSAEYEDKKGYILVVDTDPKFLRIINIYLDGETKKVRGDIPITCVLYSRVGILTDGMAPFYRKEGTEPATILSLSDYSVKETASGFVFEEVLEKEQSVSDEETKELPEKIPEETDTTDDVSEPQEEAVKVRPETKGQLFALMTRIGRPETDENLEVAKNAFSQFEFCIPYTSDTLEGVSYEEVLTEIPQGINQIYLINRENGIKAVTFFTDSDSALMFAKEHGAGVVKLTYNDYKNAIQTSLLPPPSAEGIIINPDCEQILLPPDYPLL